MKDKKLFAVLVETDNDGDTECGVLGNKVFADKKAARAEMRKDFRATVKANNDGENEIDKHTEADRCVFSMNDTFSQIWRIEELTKISA